MNGQNPSSSRGYAMGNRISRKTLGRSPGTGITIIVDHQGVDWKILAVLVSEPEIVEGRLVIRVNAENIYSDRGTGKFAPDGDCLPQGALCVFDPDEEEENGKPVIKSGRTKVIFNS